MSEELQINPYIIDVISISANESRLRILFELDTTPHSISNLAKKLDLNVQDTHRNVGRMIEVGILTKDNEGVLRVATLGKLATLLFPPFSFVFNKKEFFNSHTFDGIPNKFLQRIDVLQNCQLVCGVVKVLEKWANMSAQSEKYTKLIASQAPLESVENTLQKANEGIKVNLIVGGNTVFPSKYSDLLKHYNLAKLELNGFFETKYLEKIQFCLAITEKEASISFSGLNGEVDIDKTFFGNNPKFLEWCNELFEETWKKSTTDGTLLSKLYSLNDN